ncbi:hypothetical protein Syun_017864 [Stephania yunnanensis]|uniref:VQ domain-containing protein n=1 Tax=Stephania yunnanensis TaxID=152371 RepID=A0AAP0P2U2_9MAGN
MTSSENLASLDSWTFRSLPDSWITEAFARDTETLTRALQKSLQYESYDSLAATINNNNNNNNVNSDSSLTIPQNQYLIKPELTPTTGSPVSEIDNTAKRGGGGGGRNPAMISGGKISKRKSRATKRSPTTFITADPENFRQMVQQVTGIQFSGGHVPAVMPHVLKPEPQRLVVGNRIQNSCLPTLDTSSFLLNNHVDPAVGPHGHVALAQPSDGGVAFDFDALQSFPTLESWQVM